MIFVESPEGSRSPGSHLAASGSPVHGSPPGRFRRRRMPSRHYGFAEIPKRAMVPAVRAHQRTVRVSRVSPVPSDQRALFAPETGFEPAPSTVTGWRTDRCATQACTASEQQDLNLRPPAPQTGALPNCAMLRYDRPPVLPRRPVCAHQATAPGITPSSADRLPPFAHGWRPPIHGWVVATAGFEPATFPLSAGCSNQAELHRLTSGWPSGAITAPPEGRRPQSPWPEGTARQGPIHVPYVALLAQPKGGGRFARCRLAEYRRRRTLVCDLWLALRLDPCGSCIASAPEGRG